MGTKINEKALEYLRENDIPYTVLSNNVIQVDMMRVRNDQYLDLMDLLGNYQKKRMDKAYLDPFIMNEFQEEFNNEEIN